VRLWKIWVVLLCSTIVLFAYNQLKDAQIVKGELRLKFSDTIDKKKIHTFTLTKPYRKVFDIQNCRLADKKVGKGLKCATTRSLKVAQYRPDIVRIVVGCDAPYHCTPYKPIAPVSCPPCPASITISSPFRK